MKLDLAKISKQKSSDKSVKTNGYKVKSSEALGQFLAQNRKKKKITQEEVAMFSNLTRVVISEFENGKSDIKLSNLIKILNSCGLEIEVKEKA